MSGLDFIGDIVTFTGYAKKMAPAPPGKIALVGEDGHGSSW